MKCIPKYMVGYAFDRGSPSIKLVCLPSLTWSIPRKSYTTYLGLIIPFDYIYFLRADPSTKQC